MYSMYVDLVTASSLDSLTRWRLRPKFLWFVANVVSSCIHDYRIRLDFCTRLLDEGFFSHSEFCQLDSCYISSSSSVSSFAESSLRSSSSIGNAPTYISGWIKSSLMISDRGLEAWEEWHGLGASNLALTFHYFSDCFVAVELGIHLMIDLNQTILALD